MPTIDEMIKPGGLFGGSSGQVRTRRRSSRIDRENRLQEKQEDCEADAGQQIEQLCDERHGIPLLDPRGRGYGRKIAMTPSPIRNVSRPVSPPPMKFMKKGIVSPLARFGRTATDLREPRTKRTA